MKDHYGFHAGATYLDGDTTQVLDLGLASGILTSREGPLKPFAELTEGA